MNAPNRACLVYVPATAALRAGARARLEAEGYEVCEVLAELDGAIAAEAGNTDLPAALKDCISAAEICVFLLPENEADDGCLSGCGGLASQLGKPFIAVVSETREALPQPFDDDAAGVVRDCEDGLVGAIRGDRTFKGPDGSGAIDRNIKHIRCQ
jgi:hypothetical protein